MSETRPELDALLAEHDLDREFLKLAEAEETQQAFVMAEDQGISVDLLVVMICWYGVEKGEMTYEGDGYFKLVDE